MFCLFVVKQYILARVAGDRAEKKKDAKGRRLVDRGSVYSIGFASSHRPTTHAGPLTNLFDVLKSLPETTLRKSVKILRFRQHSEIWSTF